MILLTHRLYDRRYLIKNVRGDVPYACTPSNKHLKYIKSNECYSMCEREHKHCSRNCIIDPANQYTCKHKVYKAGISQISVLSIYLG